MIHSFKSVFTKMFSYSFKSAVSALKLLRMLRLMIDTRQ